MIEYLGNFKHIETGKIIWKIGHTQKKFLERFSDPCYDIFEKRLAAHIYFSRPNWYEAKQLALKIEHELLAPFKKPSTFMIEEYLGLPKNALNDANGKPMSGITEMFVLESWEEQQYLYEHFHKIKAKYHEEYKI